MWPFKRKEKSFKVGDIVKCINDRNWNNVDQSLNLMLGNKYKILMVIKCESCGGFSYDIGCRFYNKRIHSSCNNRNQLCGNQLPGMGIHLAGHFRFEKTTEEFLEHEIEEKLEEAVKREDYETAALLRDKFKTDIKL